MSRDGEYGGRIRGLVAYDAGVEAMYQQYEATAIRAAKSVWNKCQRASHCPQLEDLIQVGLLSLWSCITENKLYDATNPPAYLYHTVYRTCLTEVSNSADGPIDLPENFEIPSGDDLVLRSDMRDAINTLPMDCRMFCILVMDGLSATQAKRVVGWRGGLAKARIAVICEKLGGFATQTG